MCSNPLMVAQRHPKAADREGVLKLYDRFWATMALYELINVRFSQGGAWRGGGLCESTALYDAPQAAVGRGRGQAMRQLSRG